MDLFNPLVTLLLCIIIIRLSFDVIKVKEERDELLDFILREFGSIEEVQATNEEEVETMDDEFDKKIQAMRDELSGIATSVNELYTPSVSDILDPRIYNLSAEEIRELEKQIQPDKPEYSD